MLTRREKEVLEFIKKGYSNSEISELLYVSKNTIKAHISSILLKLNAKNRTEAVIKSLEFYK